MAILSDTTVDFTSSNVEQTLRLGIRLGELLQPGDVICLSGQLGTGKTALARGIGRGWGTTLRVTSPTYTLINEYPRAKDGLILYHMDLYRLQDSAEIITTGIEDILDNHAAFMIEWPEGVLDFLPGGRIDIALRHVSETRRGMRLEGIGDKRHKQLIKQFKRSAFGV